ncbi:hypothetical protein EX30DRAFT_349489 [Ascodesmis nigricans]|uniref:Uncharacterized protein n=1 Tax=Ascodesmis nigricans TaxID=341454 RepID=A0A4S2MV11_9PEZI|nr:hypothetical protein EX30DRAFT_349489 [Ascodesmis nigricans]
MAANGDTFSTVARPLVESGAPPYLLTALSLLALRPFSPAYPTTFPRRPILYTSIAFWTFGGIMATTGYPVDGAMTVTSWCVLYQAVNGGRRALTPLLKGGRVGPVVVAVGNLGVGAVEGWYWWNTRRWEEEKGEEEGKRARGVLGGW